MGTDNMKYVTNVPEGVFDHWCDLIFSVENKMRPDSPERSNLYKLRCLVGDAKLMNRTNKDMPQDRWIYEPDPPVEFSADKPVVDIEHAFVTGPFLNGRVINHPTRGTDLGMKRTRTSRVLKSEGTKFETHNTLYNVISWEKDTGSLCQTDSPAQPQQEM